MNVNHKLLRLLQLNKLAPLLGIGELTDSAFVEYVASLGHVLDVIQPDERDFDAKQLASEGYSAAVEHRRARANKFARLYRDWKAAQN